MGDYNRMMRKTGKELAFIKSVSLFGDIQAKK